MISLFYLRGGQQKGDMNLVSVKLKANLWIFTKYFPLNGFEYMKKKLGVWSLKTRRTAEKMPRMLSN